MRWRSDRRAIAWGGFSKDVAVLQDQADKGGGYQNLQEAKEEEAGGKVKVRNGVRETRRWWKLLFRGSTLGSVGHAVVGPAAAVPAEVGPAVKGLSTRASAAAKVGSTHPCMSV